MHDKLTLEKQERHHRVFVAQLAQMLGKYQDGYWSFAQIW